MTEKKDMATDTWNIYKKLARARVMLQKQNLKKSGQNKFAGFNYFELADFLPATNAIFDELGLCAIFKIEESTYTEAEDGQVIVHPALATLTIVNVDNGEEIKFSSETAEAGTKGASPIQQLGSVHTYMRRYLYMEALEIVESDGLDALNGTEKIAAAEPKKQQRKPKAAMVSTEQINKIIELFGDDAARMESMMAVYQIQKLEDLTESQAKAIIRRMEGKS